jgi:scpA/B protein
MSPEADSAETTTPLGMTSSGAAGTEAGATARVPGFSVSLPQFEGPFDLLLALIVRRRLDVTELALAEVTDEFIAHMRADWDLGRASEFLVVASTLLALKAQRLLPHDPDDEDEDLELLEARDLLFARLLQYRAYKQAAQWLSDMASTASRSHPRVVGLPAEFSSLLPQLVATIDATDLAQLAVRAFTRPADPGVQTVHLHERVPVGEQLNLIALRLRRHGTATFSRLIADAERAAVVVARFLALLILHRQGSVNLDQNEPMGEITVAWCSGYDDLAGIMSPDIEEEFG